MGRSEAISSHLKPSIIGATIYRATYRAFVRLGGTMIESIFVRVPFACLHPCKCRPQQRLEDCTEVFVARPPVLSISPTPFIRPRVRRSLIDADGRNKHVVWWCRIVCSRLPSRINFRRNNERGQKLSGPLICRARRDWPVCAVPL